MTPNLAKRSVTAVKWNIIANGVRLVLGFVGAVILARLLPVEVFGVYAIAHSIVVLLNSIAGFGTGNAFLHRTAETADIEQTAAVHFTLKIPLILLWGSGLFAGVAFFVDASQTDLRLAFAVIITAYMVVQLAQTPRLILLRRVEHTRLALIEMVNAILTFGITVSLALMGAELWVLLANDIITAVVHFSLLYLWRPIWKPSIAWSWRIVRYFFGYGGQMLIEQFISSALDRIDDIFVGAFLGQRALGFYSRAYSFARYPSFALAAPITAVALGTYAELKGQRDALSQAFNQVNSLMTRSGFLLAGILSLIAPEFILLLIGEKWLPMLTVFRLMLLFTLFDPLRDTIGGLFNAVGRPRLIVGIRIIQLVTLIVGLPLFSIPFGIEGTAIAVDLMLLVGIGFMLWHARAYVDFSLMILFGKPLLALIIAGLATLGVSNSLENISLWLNAIIKAGVFSVIYSGMLLLIDREQLGLLYQLIRRYV